MEVCKLYWFRHSCKEGQFSSAKVHRSIQAQLKDPEIFPTSMEDYQLICETLDGLEPEVLDGV